MNAPNDLAVLIERWFTDRSERHRGVSSNTIACYRDTFWLLFACAQTRLGKSPSQLTLQDLDAPFIGAFLEGLEKRRSVSVRTRNRRLTAIRSFFRYVSLDEPAHSAYIQRVLAIATKRYDKRQLQFSPNCTPARGSTTSQMRLGISNVTPSACPRMPLNARQCGRMHANAVFLCRC